jgi:hypothetical protein
VFPSLFGELKNRQDTFLCVPLLSITAYFVNVLLGNTRIRETLKNVTPEPEVIHASELEFDWSLGKCAAIGLFWMLVDAISVIACKKEVSPVSRVRCVFIVALRKHH